MNNKWEARARRRVEATRINVELVVTRSYSELAEEGSTRIEGVSYSINMAEALRVGLLLKDSTPAHTDDDMLSDSVGLRTGATAIVADYSALNLKHAPNKIRKDPQSQHSYINIVTHSSRRRLDEVREVLDRVVPADAYTEVYSEALDYPISWPHIATRVGGHPRVTFGDIAVGPIDAGPGLSTDDVVTVGRILHQHKCASSGVDYRNDNGALRVSSVYKFINVSEAERIHEAGKRILHMLWDDNETDLQRNIRKHATGKSRDSILDRIGRAGSTIPSCKITY
jgi:hypothetical protein